MACVEYYAYAAHLAYGMSDLSHMSNLDIYRGPMAPLWSHRAQYLVCVELTLVLLLSLLSFCDYTVILLPTYRPRFITTRHPESCNKLVRWVFRVSDPGSCSQYPIVGARLWNKSSLALWNAWTRDS